MEMAGRLSGGVPCYLPCGIQTLGVRSLFVNACQVGHTNVLISEGPCILINHLGFTDAFYIVSVISVTAFWRP